MGDKVQAKEAMKEAGVPLVPGTDSATTLAQARELAPEIGFPILLKAAAGGGGRGMRLVSSPAELDSAFATASAEADAAFGDGSLYVEKALVPARHVEIQVLADGRGGVLTLGERECSIQRRHQKLVEESPSPALDPATREAMEEAAERACLATGYVNAGTLEFLLDPDGSYYFIELNARLQVEHPVSELVTGIDIVHQQLRIAAGEPLSLTGRAPRSGHAIEVRINAEDPTQDFAPSPGKVERLRAPGGPGVRLRHASRGRHHDPAELRLADREADRLGHRPSGRDRPRPARTGRARDRGRRHHPRLRRRGAAQRRVHERRVHDLLPRRELAVSLSRRAARRTALFLLYQWDLTGQPLGTNYEGEVDEFALGLAEAVVARADELDARISEVSGDWPAGQLGTLERNILRIGIHELQEGTVPLEVAIDEAVTLAKRYASEDAGRLVNGILGRIARDVSMTTLEEKVAHLEELRRKVEACTDLEEAIALLTEVEAAAKELIDAVDQAKRDSDAQP